MSLFTYNPGNILNHETAASILYRNLKFLQQLGASVSEPEEFMP